MSYPLSRPRRLRLTPEMRALVRETEVLPRHLVRPFFVDGTSKEVGGRIAIPTLPGQFRLSLDALLEETSKVYDRGIRSIILFGVPEFKDVEGTSGHSDDGIVQEAVRRLKAKFIDLVVIADVCLCEYTNHGHCGILESSSTGSVVIDNDTTLKALELQALSFARAGVDMVAPSGMMDGMVRSIRTALDNERFQQVGIMSYAVKYASSFYGPFRDAVNSEPQCGDRRSHQMDPANRREAMREALLDVEEGADIIMVKPGLPYLDIINEVKHAVRIPVATYQVSGEYAMIKAAARQGMIDERSVVDESFTCLRRAGADIIISYFAGEEC
jgi:porphobilinogen synthase